MSGSRTEGTYRAMASLFSLLISSVITGVGGSKVILTRIKGTSFPVSLDGDYPSCDCSLRHSFRNRHRFGSDTPLIDTSSYLHTNLRCAGVIFLMLTYSSSYVKVAGVVKNTAEKGYGMNNTICPYLSSSYACLTRRAVQHNKECPSCCPCDARPMP
jgi:hypothetical protein